MRIDCKILPNKKKSNNTSADWTAEGLKGLKDGSIYRSVTARRQKLAVIQTWWTITSRSLGVKNLVAIGRTEASAGLLIP